MWTKNEPSNNIWRTRDVTEMADALKTAPIFIDEIKSNFNNFAKVLFCFKFIEFILITEILGKIIHFRSFCFYYVFPHRLYLTYRFLSVHRKRCI